CANAGRSQVFGCANTIGPMVCRFSLIHLGAGARLAAIPEYIHRPPAASSSTLKQANVKSNFIRPEKSYPSRFAQHVLDWSTVRFVRVLTWGASMHGFDSRYAHDAGV